MTLIEDKYLRLQIVAEILSCTEEHIRNLIIDGELVAIKVGIRAVRISELSLKEFIEKRKINPKDFFDPDKEKKSVPTEPKVLARSKFMAR